MSRALICVVLILALCGLARAEDPPPLAAAAAPPAKPTAVTPKKPKRVRHASTRPAGTAATAPWTAKALLDGAPASGARDRPAAGASRDRAWSIDPSWSASSGPTAAAYGTRGLLDELKHTPGESSGYSGGAKVDFHF